MNIKQKRAAALAAAKALVEGAKSADRELTGAERTQFDGLVGEVKGYDVQLAAADKAGPGVLKQLELSGGDYDASQGTDQFLNLNAKSYADSLRGKMTDGPDGAKALASQGAVLSEVPLIDTTPLVISRPLNTLLDTLPVVARPAQYQYLRQVTRTNNAAPVAPGALKPTSTMGLEKVEGRLRVVAHLSEPMDRFMLEDNSNLSTFVSSELVGGLRDALERQILSGAGTGETFTGLANTAGVQIIAATVDRLVTLRAAITALETLGITPGTFVVAAGDWQAIETARHAGGGFDVGGPIDAGTRRVWGVPVAISTVVPAGTAYLIGQGCAVLGVDTSGIRTDWGTPGETFSRNELVARTEGRFSLDVLRPNGIAKISMTPAA